MKRIREVTLCRVSLKANEHMKRVKRATKMGTAHQIDELLALKKHMVAHDLVPLGSVKGVVRTHNKKHKYKTAFGHVHRWSVEDYCLDCGVSQDNLIEMGEQIRKALAIKKSGIKVSEEDKINKILLAKQALIDSRKKAPSD